ncbi:hypothetical protein ABZT48_39210 [Streptomyces avermitilis]|uniref:hypothetical protein n=1 Tax=Streptomyces avermitilis TaxID=33903 RepID=UPI0033A7C797
MKTRNALIVGITCSVAVVMTTGTASASNDSPVSVVKYSDCSDSDKQSASGWFESSGDWFYARDDCTDGHSAVLQVDAAPMGTSEHYDWKLTNTGGASNVVSEQHNYSEDLRVQVRACVYEGSTELACGNWTQGYA